MNTQDMQKALDEAVQDVFETMFFMFPEPLGKDDTAPWVSELIFLARVGLKNTPHAVVLHASETLAHHMAAAIIGTDRPIPEAEVLDVLKEAVNMVGGCLVTFLNLHKQVSLDVPQAERLDSSPLLKSATVYDVDGELLCSGIVVG
ncbi:MAG: chemotaxis protein CheX [Deltaproteobacteria bacterium]|nr:chemotaxis protein CheX [Deltaproteobacteria bacterium]